MTTGLVGKTFELRVIKMFYFEDDANTLTDINCVMPCCLALRTSSIHQTTSPRNPERHFSFSYAPSPCQVQFSFAETESFARPTRGL